MLKYYLQIYSHHTTAPSGIWYSNFLATFLNERHKDLFYEDWTGYCDPDLFEKVGYSSFKLKPGKSATEACQKLIKTLTVQDCGNVSQLVYYLAISDQIGKERFDAHVANSSKPLFISTYTPEAPTNSVLFDFLEEAAIASPSVENQRPLELCQLCYFRNYPDYLIKHPTGSDQGFNSIYIGRNGKNEQLYISFWDGGPKTEAEIVALLKERFTEPPDLWDRDYFESHPDEKKETKIDPAHQFFDDQKIYSYVFNLSKLK